MAVDAAPSADNEDKWLADALASVKQNAFFMRRSLDESNLREALKYSTAMLGELRTSQLSPPRYYELYMRTCDELGNLEAYFADESRRGHSNAELYELVQHAGNILPRLYLLCTAGAVYVRSADSAAKEVLKDLVEMCKGVQHPTRGLFLRAYLTQVSKGLLADVGTKYAGEPSDAVAFLLQNFGEMNRLWVRLAHQGPAREAKRREAERQQLRDLVGKNVTALSSLEAVDSATYATTVLPALLEQVVSCKDDAAQLYLMEVIIQAFPDDYHLSTLDALLAACPQLQPGVDFRAVLGGLAGRLQRYAAAGGGNGGPAALEAAGVFPKLLSCVGAVCDAHGTAISAEDVASLYGALMAYTAAVAPSSLTHADAVLAGCASSLGGRGRATSPPAVAALMGLLSAPLKAYDVVHVLSLAAYPRVMALLDGPTRKVLAVTLVKAALSTGAAISTPDVTDALFEFVAPLIRDESRPPESPDAGVSGLRTPACATCDDDDTASFDEEQGLLARLVHRLVAPTPAGQLEVLAAAHKHLSAGGPKRMRHTLPPLAFAGLALAERVAATPPAPTNAPTPESSATVAEPTASADAEASQPSLAPPPPSLASIYGFVQDLVQTLSDLGEAELALRLLLPAAEGAASHGLESVSSELLTLACLLYEEGVSDSRAQLAALTLLIGTLARRPRLEPESRESLVSKVGSYCGTLLRRGDQCRALMAASHMHWDADEGGGRDGAAVRGLLGRSGRAAALAAKMAPATWPEGGPAVLFVELLNKHLYYFDAGDDPVPASLVTAAAAAASAAATEGAPGRALWEPFLEATKRHLALQKAKPGPAGARYAGIEL